MFQTTLFGRTPGESLRTTDLRHAQSAFVRGSALRESILAALRAAACALRSGAAGGRPDDATREALGIACAIAHRQELRAEQLLLLVKEGWRLLPEVQLASRTDADVALATVITHCIKEYYRPTE